MGVIRLVCRTGYPYNNATAQTFAGHPMRFTETKSETLNLRVSPTFKQLLKQAAHHEQRSMVNMLEVLVAAHCDANGIVIPVRRAARKHRAANRVQTKANA